MGLRLLIREETPAYLAAIASISRSFHYLPPEVELIAPPFFLYSPNFLMSFLVIDSKFVGCNFPGEKEFLLH